MYMIEFARLEDGLYEIADGNDERLYVIGTLVSNDTIRAALSKALKYAPDVGMEKHLDIETKEYALRVSPMTEDNLFIKMVDKHDERHLETDIRIDALLDLIENWEDAVEEEPESITITRVQDTFFLETA